MKRTTFIAVFLLAVMATGVMALEVPSLAGRRFHNESASLKLSDAQVEAVEDRLAEMEKDNNGMQMAVLLIDSLEGESLEEFSLKVAEQWKLGQKRGKGQDGDNGLLLIVAVQDKKYRFEVGYGLEGELPDGLIGSLGRELLVPNFREGRYIEGIDAVIEAIWKSLHGELQPSQQTKNYAPNDALDAFLNKAMKKIDELDNNSLWVICIMLVLVVVLDFIHVLLGGAAGLISGGLFSWVFIGHEFSNLAFFAAIGFFVGMVARYIVIFGIMLALDGVSGGGSSGGRGGGAFSGGGGSFGGGGASGSW